MIAKETSDHENSSKSNLQNGNEINADGDSTHIDHDEHKDEKKVDTSHYTKKEPIESPVERVKFVGIDDDDDDEDSFYSEESFQKKLPPIPDGGWGWVVVASAFLVSACVDGLAFSFGLLHEEFTRYFETTQSQTSLIGSLFIATPLLAGPIASAIVDRFGCRVMTIIAGLLSTIGFLLAAISNSVLVLSLTFGLLSGLAMSILYVTSVVAVAFWFDKRRNLAVSLALCGMGFGTVIYSPLTHYFLQVYDWRNTVVLLAGTLLNMCVCGALMRNPEWLEIKQRRERRVAKARSKKSSSVASLSSRSFGEDSEYLGAEELKSLLQSGQSPEYILATLATSIVEAEKLEATTMMNAEQTFKRNYSAIHLPTFILQNEMVPSEVIEKLMENKNLYNIVLQNYPDSITRRKSELNVNVETPSTNIVTEPAKQHVEIKVKKPKHTQTENEKLEEKKTVERKKSVEVKTKIQGTDDNAKNKTNKDAKLHAQPSWLWQISTDHQYLRDMPLYRKKIMHRGAMLSIPRYRLRASSLPDMYRNSMWSFESDSDDEMEWYHRFWQSTKNMFDFRMLMELHFFLLNLSSMILSVWFIVPYFFLNSYMKDYNVEGGATMISIIGVASSIGIVALGWTGDQPWVNVTKTYAICLIVCGVSVAAYPLFITNYWMLSVISAVFGVTFASTYSYTPAILMELLPVENFTVGYGLILLNEGIGHLIGPPIGGKSVFACVNYYIDNDKISPSEFR